MTHPASGLSAMLWFRADPSRDDEVRAALQRVATLISAQAAARIGHRHEEDRPYRTWMIDAGPIDPARLDSLMWRLQKAFNSAGLPALAKGEPQVESFLWLDAHGGEAPPCA